MNFVATQQPNFLHTNDAFIKSLVLLINY